MFTRININIRPSGGYVFRETDGSMHRAGNWAAVIQKVKEYRQRKNQNVDTLEAEVMEQGCKRYPSLCRPEAQNIPPQGIVSARPVPVSRADPPAFKARVLMWMSHLFGARTRNEPIALVSPDEAAARESICATCPQNQPFIGSGCSSCKTAVANYRDGIIPGRPRYDRLRGCLILGTDLVTAVHLDEVRIENPALPANCWRRKAI